MTHPATAGLLRWFDYEHLPPHLQEVPRVLGGAAKYLAGDLVSSPELTAGIRKLLEAKDCFVRAAIITRESQQ